MGIGYYHVPEKDELLLNLLVLHYIYHIAINAFVCFISFTLINFLCSSVVLVI